MQGLKFANVPDVLLRYRMSPDQVTFTRNREMYLTARKIRLEYAEHIINQILEKDTAYCDFLNLLIKLLNDNLVSINSFFILYFSFIRIIWKNYNKEKSRSLLLTNDICTT